MNPALIGGVCVEEFRRVRDVFSAHMESGLEIGAGVCVFVHGQKVVDLWGGWRDRERCLPWSEDTIVCMQSTGKGVAMMCLLMLVDRGLLDLDAPMVRYWPEFGQAGKQDITLRTVFSQGAGLPCLDAAPPGSAYDRKRIVRAIEQQAPVWPPGTQHGYHIFTIGYLMDELMRRVAGMPIAEFLRRNVSDPMGADFFFELSDAEQARCAPLYSDSAASLLAGDADSLVARSVRPLPADHDYNAPAFRRWGIPNAGHGNARGLASIFSACLSDTSDALVSPVVMADATREHWRGQDAVLGMPMRGGLVFMLSNEIVPFTGGPRSYGIPGAGGSIGMADPDLGLAFAFCTNRAVPVGQETMMRDLVQATRSCL